jgi:hypothetical protein
MIFGIKAPDTSRAHLARCLRPLFDHLMSHRTHTAIRKQADANRRSRLPATARPGRRPWDRHRRETGDAEEKWALFFLYAAPH